jgi:hypothetical protein
MIVFITSAALLYWATWLYYSHVIKPIRDEQDSDNYENAKALTFLGNSEAVCQTAVIEECPDCNGSTVLKAFINIETRLFYLADCKRCNGQGIIELN